MATARRTPSHLGALLGQDLDRVDELLILVVALAGVLLGLLVGPYRAGPLQHGGEGSSLTEIMRSLSYWCCTSDSIQSANCGSPLR
jgi:hypothetical protein